MRFPLSFLSLQFIHLHGSPAPSSGKFCCAILQASCKDLLKNTYQKVLVENNEEMGEYGIRKNHLDNLAPDLCTFPYECVYNVGLCKYTHFREEILGKVDNTEPLSLPYWDSVTCRPFNCAFKLSTGKERLYFACSSLFSFHHCLDAAVLYPFGVTSSLRKIMHRWLTAPLSFRTRDWRPAHFRTPDKLCFMPVGSSVP